LEAFKTDIGKFRGGGASNPQSAGEKMVEKRLKKKEKPLTALCKKTPIKG